MDINYHKRPGTGPVEALAREWNDPDLGDYATLRLSLPMPGDESLDLNLFLDSVDDIREIASEILAATSPGRLKENDL